MGMPYSNLVCTIFLVFHMSHLVTGDCCTESPNYDGGLRIDCPDIKTSDEVECVHRFLRTTSDLWHNTKTLDIYFTNSNADLFSDDFFAGFNVVGLGFNRCGLTEVPYRLFGYMCSMLINGLRLDSNSITSLKPGGFANCTQLQILEITANNIDTLSPDSLQGLNSLQSLYLTLNSITRIDGFGDARKVVQLYLDNNNISSIDKNAFQGMSNLKQLHLETNQIVLMEDGTLDGIHLTEHNFAENPFYCNCSLKWFQNWLNQNPSSTDGATCDKPDMYHNEPLQYTEFCSDTTTSDVIPTFQTTTILPSSSGVTNTSKHIVNHFREVNNHL